MIEDHTALLRDLTRSCSWRWGRPGMKDGRARSAFRRGRVISGPSAIQTAGCRGDPSAASRRCRFCPRRDRRARDSAEMSTTPAAQLAWLRVQFPDWRIIRTECGTYIARHRLTGDRVQSSRELADQAVAGEVLGQIGSRRGRH